MANPTAARDDKQSFGHAITVPMEESTTIYAGSLVNANAAGYAVVAADTSGHHFLGVAADTVVNSGADGAKKIMVYVEGTFEMVHSASATQASVGTIAYVVDGQTVAATSTNKVIAGKIVEFVSATAVRIKLTHDTEHTVDT